MLPSKVVIQGTENFKNLFTKQMCKVKLNTHPILLK